MEGDFEETVVEGNMSLLEDTYGCCVMHAHSEALNH